MTLTASNNSYNFGTLINAFFLNHVIANDSIQYRKSLFLLLTTNHKRIRLICTELQNALYLST